MQRKQNLENKRRSIRVSRGRDKNEEEDLGRNGSPWPVSLHASTIARKGRATREEERKERNGRRQHRVTRVEPIFGRQNASRTIAPWCIAAYGVNQAAATTDSSGTNPRSHYISQRGIFITPDRLDWNKHCALQRTHPYQCTDKSLNFVLFDVPGVPISRWCTVLHSCSLIF